MALRVLVSCLLIVAAMDSNLTSQVDTFVRGYLIPIGWKLLGAAALWIVGGWGIRLVRAALNRFLNARQFDVTLTRYIDASASVLLKLLLLIAVLGVLGIETTSFAALLAAAGLAVGAAWSGLLANFAAGLFLLTFRPFKVGDIISAAGVTGTVREVGLFTTSIDTSDGVLTFVGNNKLFADNVQNLSANPRRRVDLTASLPVGSNVELAVTQLRDRVQRVPHVLATPAPAVEVLSLAATGPVLVVRPFCATEHYWQVYFDVNREISKVCVPSALT